ncbi:MAG: ABC transporter permease [Candidatus Sumerlaeia bacterium]|nr:ABC transporter permease [Candidatus Sumerlaeia bacterium]
MTAAPVLPPARDRVLLVGRGVWIEIVRRKEFYVLLILVALFCLAALAVSIVGVSNPETATLLLNMGLTLAAGAAHLLTLVTAARQIPAEIENRTLYPMLAKPIGRGEFFLGKWAAVASAGYAVFLVLLVLVWASVPKMESYDAALFVQLVLLQGVSIAFMAAAALALSLWMPTPVVLVLLALVYAFGAKGANLLQAATAGGALEGPARVLAAYLPNFSLLNVVTRFTDGIGALGGGQLLGLLAYASVWTAAAFFAGARSFGKRPL